ncbi:MAG: hypothetical protein AB7F88_05105 [Pyrinomonadaceae bacterium]
MTRVVILPSFGNGRRYRAIAGEKESYGSTMGEALDALAEHLKPAEDETVVFVQDFRPDEFFTEDQQRRLSYLMNKWRTARDAGEEFPALEQEELEKLIEVELEGSAKRAERLAGQLS